MDFDDLVTLSVPPANRAGKHSGTHEEHFHEGAIMLAFTMYLFRDCAARTVRIHPDGEHGKRTPFSTWLGKHGFTKVSNWGSTEYGGTYRNIDGGELTIQPKSGLGDVVAEIAGVPVSAECKGGVINSRHAGQRSRLDRGLCEAIGRLMASPPVGRKFAVVPSTPVTQALGQRMSGRCKYAGIEIALVGSRGEITIL